MYNLQVLLTLGLFLLTNCQQYRQQYNPQQEDQYQYQSTIPPPQILTHKQALNHDGNFKYVFTSDNGLAQGESIAPDGSRNGGYSYVDPTGRKISVKYTAGKEGFRILEADHLPKAPQPIAPLPQPTHQQSAYPQPQALGYNQNQEEDDGQYKPQIYERPQQFVTSQPRLVQAEQQQRYTSIHSNPVNTIEKEEKDYYDEPGKPHSFGSGYIFEFGG